MKKITASNALNAKVISDFLYEKIMNEPDFHKRMLAKTDLLEMIYSTRCKHLRLRELAVSYALKAIASKHYAFRMDAALRFTATIMYALAE